MIKRYSAEYVANFDKKSREYRFIKNGYVELNQDGEVIGIGENNSSDIDREIYKGIIVPGFINGHAHIELSHLKGLFKEATGMSGFINQINSLRESVDYNNRIKAIEKQLENLYNQGVVGVSDISNCSESFALKKDSKIYFRTFVELFGSETPDAEDVIESGKKVIDSALEIGIDASITPHSCYTMSPKLLELSVKEGLKSGYISFHSQESQEEEDMIVKGTGALWENYKKRGLSTPPTGDNSALIYFIKRCYNSLNKEYGASSNREKIDGKINLVHNVVINQLSIDAAIESFKTPFFTICPLSNIFIHRELPPLELMIKNNLKICIGTDSLSSNKVLDMVKEMFTIQNNFKGIRMEKLLKWATINGAEVIGKEDIIGSFDKGKKPGIVLIENLDLENFKFTNESISKRLDKE